MGDRLSKGRRVAGRISEGRLQSGRGQEREVGARRMNEAALLAEGFPCTR